MRHEFDMECYADLGLIKVWTHDITCAVEIEPDEVGDATYYIARVYIEGQAKGGKTTYHVVSDANPLHAQIAAYAYKYRRDELDELWNDWLADHPRARKLRDDAEREHRTHGGSL